MTATTTSMNQAFNWDSVMETQSNHYASLAMSPGWRDYARQQVRDMEAMEGDHWIGLLDMVRSKLAENGKK